MFEKLVQDDFWGRASLKLDHDAHAFSVRLIVHARDADDPFLGVRF